MFIQMLPHFNVYIIGFEEIWAASSCNSTDQEQCWRIGGFPPAFEEWVKHSWLETEWCQNSSGTNAVKMLTAKTSLSDA